MAVREPAWVDAARAIGVAGGSDTADRLDTSDWSRSRLDRTYDAAFANRVEYFFLQAIGASSTQHPLSGRWRECMERSEQTARVVVDVDRALDEAGIDHAIFKSIKRYPATPNDTDVLVLGGQSEYRIARQALVRHGYIELGVAPMQTLLAHPSGAGRVSRDKSGGTYYVDLYRGVAADYFEYVSKEAIAANLTRRRVGEDMVTAVAPECELGIVMFHNVFPEKTFHLEHYYQFALELTDPTFDVDRFLAFVHDNALDYAVARNVEVMGWLERRVFGEVSAPIAAVMQSLGRKVRPHGHVAVLPRSFPATVFWRCFASKLRDPSSRRALGVQARKMMDRQIFIETMRSAWSRTLGGAEIYAHK